MIYDQEAKIVAQSSLYPDVLYNIVYRKNVLFTCLSCVIKMKHQWLSHSLLNNHFHLRVNDPIYVNVFHVHKSDYSLFQRFSLAR